MAKYPGLKRRDNGIWYVRKRVPVDLGHIEPRSSIRLSLDTTDKRKAIRLYPFKLAAIEQQFTETRNQLQSAGRVSAALKVGKLERLGDREIEKIVSDWWTLRAPIRQPAAESAEEVDEIIADMEDDARHLGTHPGDSELVHSVADRLLIGAGMVRRSHRVGKIKTQIEYPIVDRSTPAYRYLCQLIARALKTEVALAKDHLLAQRNAPFDALFNSNDQGNNDIMTKRLSDLSIAYRADRSVLRGEDSTEKKYDFPFRVMEEVLGAEKTVSSITRADCLKVRAFLDRLPPNAKKRFPKLTLTEIADKADTENLPRLAPNSVGSYMQSVLAVLRWAEDEGWGIKVNARDLVPKRSPVVKRRGFLADELRTLFGQLEQFRETEPEKFWVPALAVFTGARAGEICQLDVADVVEVQTVPCLNLSLFDADGRRVEDKRLKTKTSERFVPLHPYLIGAGFLAFVEQQAADGRLFPNLQKGPDGRYSHAFSKWFGRFKKKVGFEEPALVFHSFRHGFRDACRHAEIAEETAFALGGWATDGEATKYGDRAMVPVT